MKCIGTTFIRKNVHVSVRKYIFKEVSTSDARKEGSLCNDTKERKDMQ